MTSLSPAPRPLSELSAAALMFLRSLDGSRHQVAAGANLTLTELRALTSIAEAVSITPKHLAHALTMTTGAIAAIATRLVALDLLVRVAHPSDGRSLLLELSPHGHAVMAGIYAHFDTLILGKSDAIEADDRDRLTALLTTVAQAILTEFDTTVGELDA